MFQKKYLVEKPYLFNPRGTRFTAKMFRRLYNMGILAKRYRVIFMGLTPMKVTEYHWAFDLGGKPVLVVPFGERIKRETIIEKADQDELERIVRIEIENRDGWDYMITSSKCSITFPKDGESKTVKSNSKHVAFLMATNQEVIEEWINGRKISE